MSARHYFDTALAALSAARCSSVEASDRRRIEAMMREVEALRAQPHVIAAAVAERQFADRLLAARVRDEAGDQYEFAEGKA